MITAQELNRAIAANVRDVVVYGSEDQMFRVPLSVAVGEEYTFAVPGIDGEFEPAHIGRAVDEPGTYEFIYKHGDQFFAIFGSYDSWSGTEIYDETFYEAEKVPFVREVWRVKR